MRPSLSWSPELAPLPARMPTTWNGTLPIRMYCPNGSRPGSSIFSRTFWPITATAAALASSASV
ncbi:hypothetical protein D3C80_1546170 [compost metagenome]